MPLDAPLSPMPAPLVQAAGPIFIGIDVQADGRLKIILWRGTERNASYAPCHPEQAMRRQLPEAIAEAIEFAQPLAGSTDTE